MNNNYYAKLKIWFNARNFRERILLILAGCAALYMLWTLLLTRPLSIQERTLQSNIISLKTQINLLQAKADSIVKAATENAVNQKLAQEKDLILQAATIKQRIDDLTRTLLTKEDLPKLLNDVSIYQDGVRIVNLKYVGKEPLIPAHVDATTLPVYTKALFRDNYQMQFQSTYFKTISYLQYLEALKWHLYIDSLQYKVETYPNAIVILNFHVLTNQAD